MYINPFPPGMLFAGNAVCPRQNFLGFPECIWVEQNSGKHVWQDWHKETAVAQSVN